MNIRVLTVAVLSFVTTVTFAHDFGDETIAFYPFTDGAAGTSAIGVPLKNLINPDVLAGRVENKGYGKCTFSSAHPGRYVFTNLAYGAGCVYENPGSLYFTTQTGVGKSSDTHHAEVWFDDLCKEALKLGAYKIEFFYKLADDMASVNTDTATFCGGWKNGSYTDYWLGWQILAFGSATQASQRLLKYSNISPTTGARGSGTNSGTYTYPENGSHRDGKWHHVAVVYPFAETYVKWINDGEQTAGGCRRDLSSWTDGEPDLARPFILNRGSYFRGWISCVRLSRHNPNDYQPLHASNVETCVPRTMTRLRFEDGAAGTDLPSTIKNIADSASSVNTQLFYQTGIAARITGKFNGNSVNSMATDETVSAPTFAAAVKKNRVFENAADTVGATNALSADFVSPGYANKLVSGSGIRLPSGAFAPLKARDPFTVEFSFKFDYNDWKARVGDSTSTRRVSLCWTTWSADNFSSSAYPCSSMAYLDFSDVANPFIAVVGQSGANNWPEGKYVNKNLLNGGWHQFAMTVDPTGCADNRAKVTVYYDLLKVIDRAEIQYPANYVESRQFWIARGDRSSSIATVHAFDGKIDEVRISYGALGLNDFLYQKGVGGILLIVR